jgi:hypothetical protein
VVLLLVIQVPDVAARRACSRNGCRRSPEDRDKYDVTGEVRCGRVTTNEEAALPASQEEGKQNAPDLSLWRKVNFEERTLKVE